MLAAGEKLKADNAATPNFSGIYLPGKNWFAALPFLWVNGGDIATQEGGKWIGKLASAESVKGLTQFQKFIDRDQRRTRSTATTPRTTSPSATARSA